jgi:hypothetical protein
MSRPLKLSRPALWLASVWAAALVYTVMLVFIG